MPREREVATEFPGDEAPPSDGPAQLVSRIEGELELLVRNVEILERLSKSPPIGIIRLSEALRLPIHKTRYSLHLLEREGVVQPSADGAVVTDRVQEYWTVMRTSLDRMEALIRELRARSAEAAERPPIGRKGY